ncbi:MAG: hypothetical protein Q9221_009190 [Calogaya cf. arnoldii]
MDVETLVWESFNPSSVMRRLPIDSGGVTSSTNASNKLQDPLKDGSPELLMDALSDRDSSITMTDRDEIVPDVSLLENGLDSLFSPDIRDWIRRTLDADVALKEIISTRYLRVLANRDLFLPEVKHTTQRLQKEKIPSMALLKVFRLLHQWVP